MSEIGRSSGEPPRADGAARAGSPLVLYYLAAGLWFIAGMVTMVRDTEGPSWMPYFCITMGMLFYTMARRRSRREEREWREENTGA